MKKFISIIIIAFIITFIVLFACSSSAEKDILGWEYYAVTSGDTLWDICSNLDGADNYDVREIINLVEHRNNIKNATTLNGIIELPIFTEYRLGYVQAMLDANPKEGNIIYFGDEIHQYN